MKWIVAVMLLVQFRAEAQSVTFPEVKAAKLIWGTKYTAQWTPSEYFVSRHPNILTTGLTSFTDVADYPAKDFNNTNPIAVPNRIFVLFTGYTLPELDKNDEDGDSTLKTSYMPMYYPEEKRGGDGYGGEGIKFYTNEGLVNVKNTDSQSKSFYELLNKTYQEQVKGLFEIKGATNVVYLPLASFNLAAYDIKPDDLIFEFSYKFTWSNVGKGGRRIKKTVSDYGAFYTLNIRDCSGKIIKQYKQAVFSNVIPKLNYYGSFKGTNITVYEEVYFGLTYVTALRCLLNQFTGDKNIKAEIAKNTTAVKVQHATNKYYLEAFKSLTKAKYYRFCQMNVLSQIEVMNHEVILLGFSGVDVSGTPMYQSPVLQSYSPALAGAVSSAAAGMASLITMAINESNKAKARKITEQAKGMSPQFTSFKQMEDEAIEEFNRAVAMLNQTEEKATNAYTTNNEDNYNKNSVGSSGNFWGDGSKQGKSGNSNTKGTGGNTTKSKTNTSYTGGGNSSNTYTNTKSTDKPASYGGNTNDFWDEGTTTKSKGGSGGNSNPSKNSGYTPTAQQQNNSYQDGANVRGNTYGYSNQQQEPPQTNNRQPEGQGYSGAVVMKPVYYKVKEGDNLYSIAVKYGTTIDELKMLNDLSGGLKPGMELVVGIKRE